MDTFLISHWTVWFQVQAALPGLAQPQAIEIKTASGADYGFTGQRHGKLKHCQLMISLKGLGYFKRVADAWELPPGSAILYDFKDPQMAYGLPPGSSDPWRWLRFGFYGADAAVAALCKEHPSPFSIPLDGDLVKQLKHYKRFAGRDPSISAGKGASLVATVLDEIQRAMHAHADQSSNQTAHALEQWLQSHAHEPGIQLQDATSDLGKSAEHLGRSYKRHYGMKPSQRLEQLRMRLACRRISEAQQSIGDVAHSLGFTSSSHFARRFKLQYGITPSTWKARGYPPLA